MITPFIYNNGDTIQWSFPVSKIAGTPSAYIVTLTIPAGVSYVGGSFTSSK